MVVVLFRLHELLLKSLNLSRRDLALFLHFLRYSSSAHKVGHAVGVSLAHRVLKVLNNCLELFDALHIGVIARPTALTAARGGARTES